VKTVLWTSRARDDLRSIRDFIAEDSPQVATVVVGRILSATERIAAFPESGRYVPEFESRNLREIILRPYRVVYRLVGSSQVHILTIHHGARLFPTSL